ncbi:MAG: hypothetical protein M3O65_11110, partial [Actinomycetota bacterium]|nr:hypothetical protein [Actinomycetota bacterium]
MSIRDGLEPSRSPDSETHTQPLPRDEVAPAHRDGASDPRPATTPNDPATSPAGEPWPPSWG